MMGTEAKLKKHASMPASKAHKGLKTGGVVMGQAGFKKGGSVPKSGILPVAESERGAKGYVKTKMDTAHVDKAKGPTGDVKMGKPGGYKTGGVAMGQGGYKKGGAAKKHYATGGLVDSGKPVAYPKKPASAAVSNDRQSGTFKKGGKVKFNDGGAAGPMSNYEKGKKTIPPRMRSCAATRRASCSATSARRCPETSPVISASTAALLGKCRKKVAGATSAAAAICVTVVASKPWRTKRRRAAS